MATTAAYTEHCPCPNKAPALQPTQDASDYSTLKQSGTKRKASCVEDMDEQPPAKQPRTLPLHHLPAPLQLAKRSFASIGQVPLADLTPSSVSLHAELAEATAEHPLWVIYKQMPVIPLKDTQTGMYQDVVNSHACIRT